MPDLLIELFSEEIPARMQTRAAEDLQKLVTNGLVEAGLTYEGAAAFSTPRRLALTVHGVSANSPTQREERRGPKVGAPDKAIDGFLRGAGVTRDMLEERDDKKGRFYYATVVTQGRPAQDITAEVLEKTIRGFPWPKSMRWGTGSLRWVRPLHRILCLLTDESGAQVVDLDIDGIRSSNLTEGHRFLAPDVIEVAGFEDYQAKLKRASVLLSASERADMIWQDATNQAFAQGLEIVEDPGLLREVAGLVEFPVVLMGDIGEDFLGLPPEVLQTSMKEHQKFFSVRNPATGRIEKFVTVANMKTADNGTTILTGNQKVLAARLSDAKFFWENDLRVATTQGLSAWTDRLSDVTFHNKLGSEQARILRIAELARELAPAVGADPDLAEQAARVAKADLSSEMVYEFPELQGLMGRYYAEAAQLPADVAAACQDHYAPLGPTDDVPTRAVSVAVALADKLDKLAGFWAIDEKPTGSKDPFALRRAALGVIRLILDNNLRLRLDRYIDAQLVRNKGVVLDPIAEAEVTALLDAIAEHGVFKAAYLTVKDKMSGQTTSGFDDIATQVPDKSDDILGFFHDRLKVYLRDKGIRHDVIDACLAMDGADDLRLLVNRAEALAQMLGTDDGVNLVQGFKRANNILKQAEENDGVEYSYGADPKFAENPEETALFAALDAADAEITKAMASENLTAAMIAMAKLRQPTDAFFEAVQVNSDNQIVRRNRLNLLSRIRQICLQVADLALLEG